jgi:hypothetical protein
VQVKREKGAIGDLGVALEREIPKPNQRKERGIGLGSIHQSSIQIPVDLSPRVA